MADFRVAASESFAYLREQQVDLTTPLGDAHRI
jgi:hypothetical protein